MKDIPAGHARSARLSASASMLATQQSRKHRVAAGLAAVAGGVAALEEAQSLERIPQHTSVLSGAAWVKELMTGNAARMRNNLGMNQHVFLKLVAALEDKAAFSDSRWVSKEEQLATFLFAAVTNNTNRKLAERFQRSGDTISKALHHVIDTILSPSFYRAYVKLPDANTVPLHIADNPKFFPYFKDCLGATDGCQTLVIPPANIADSYRSRKGTLSINLLAASDFNMAIVYALSGWEGSACDSTVFDDARSKDFAVPAGKYYLGDAGFPTCDAVLIPYRGVRYHLREWATGNVKPQNAKELFNLRHSQLRNVIERTFGVIKKRFVMMREASYLPIDLQSKAILAMLAIHNFIRFHDPDDVEDLADTDFPDSEEQPGAQAAVLGGDRTAAEGRRADRRRDEIAEEMWADYQRTLRRRRGV